MRVIVVGLGVQGKKRQFHAGEDFICSVDPVNVAANYQDVTAVPLDAYDAALVCLPDEPKYAVLKYLLSKNKHVLVEKPLWTETDEQILELETLAHSNQLVCYTAYNHRFEPHFVRMKELLQSDELGAIRYCRMFYGNGTARLVRESAWRDQGAGVLPDLGSHLLDTLHYWFEQQPQKFEIVVMNNFENRAPDHVVIMNKATQPQFTLEMSLLSWRNHFVCEMVGEKGSAFIESLCKWGPSKFTHYERILPSGKPPEKSITLAQEDPTWALEYRHFKNLIKNKVKTNLTTDLWIQQELNQLTKTINKVEIMATNAANATCTTYTDHAVHTNADFPRLDRGIQRSGYGAMDPAVKPREVDSIGEGDNIGVDDNIGPDNNISTETIPPQLQQMDLNILEDLENEF